MVHRVCSGNPADHYAFNSEGTDSYVSASHAENSALVSSLPSAFGFLHGKSWNCLNELYVEAAGGYQYFEVEDCGREPHHRIEVQFQYRERMAHGLMPTDHQIPAEGEVLLLWMRPDAYRRLVYTAFLELPGHLNFTKALATTDTRIIYDGAGPGRLLLKARRPPLRPVQFSDRAQRCGIKSQARHPKSHLVPSSLAAVEVLWGMWGPTSSCQARLRTA